MIAANVLRVTVAWIVVVIVLFDATNCESENFQHVNRQRLPLDHYIPSALHYLSESIHASEYLKKHDIYDAALNPSSNYVWHEPWKATEKLKQLLNQTSTGNYTHGSSCLADFLLFLERVVGKESWAVKMVDSYGKPGSGILQGNIRWPGSYSECVQVFQDDIPEETYHGQYCWINYNLQPSVMKGVPNMSWTPPLQMAVCVPDSCSAQTLNKVFNETQEFLTFLSKYMTFSGVTCVPRNLSMWNDTKVVISFCVLCVFLVLMLLGTAFDLYLVFFHCSSSEKNDYKRMRDSGSVTSVTVSRTEKEIGSDESKQEPPILEINSEAPNEETPPVEYKEPEINFIGKLLLTFSMYTNGAKILSLEQSKENLAPLNGIRFFSMTWVILGHTYLLGSVQTDNVLVLVDVMKTLTFQLVAQGPFSVDSFFVMSGLLVTYLYLKEHKRSNGSISWIKFYLHRYWRLTPTYILVMFLITEGFTKYWSNGPFWYQMGGHDTKCEKYWWWNILYINNFQSAKDMCMPHTWYLANDMQFYIISPLILILLTRARLCVYAVIVGFVFIVIQWIASGLISLHFGFTAAVDLTIMAPGTEAYYKMFDNLYDKPYTRIGPYIIGMACGWLLFQTKGKVKLHTVWVILGWVLAAVCNLSLVFGMYHNNPGIHVSAFYHSVSRTAWAVGLSWVIFACCNGYGGIVNNILSWPAWNPLSRLTYCAYLWHLTLVSTIINSSDVMGHFSHTTMIYTYLANVVVTYVGALFLSLAFESPVLGLERLLLNRKS